MEKNSAKLLPIKAISEVVDDTRRYILNRKSGKEKSLKVKSNKVNKSFMNGFDWGRIVTIAGLSGSGKSTILRQWIREIIELNPTESFEVLSFQFEMLGVDEVARDISAATGKTVKQLYSAESTITDKDVTDIDATLESIKTFPISIIDTMGDVASIRDTIVYFAATNKLIENNKALIVTLDHTLLVKGDSEKETIDDLMKMLVGLKKLLASKGLKVLFFIISQLNRNIESSERITNPRLHYPNKTDLFGASSVYYSSDYVIILHRPALLDGIGNWYGPARTGFPSGLPVFNPANQMQSMIYLHVIKERFGHNKIIPMVDELNKSMITEYELS